MKRSYRRRRTQQARILRSHETEAERRLWQQLRRRQIAGLKFRRQHPILRFVVDFYCIELSLAIELDGNAHRSPEAKAVDTERRDHLATLGVTELRFWNQEVLSDIHSVLGRIQRVAQELRKQQYS